MLCASLIKELVKQALAEDIGSGDITAKLIPLNKQAHARIITREPMILCGEAFVREVFHQVNPDIKVEFYVHDGKNALPDQTLFEAKGSARSLLTAERTALNFFANALRHSNFNTSIC